DDRAGIAKGCVHRAGIWDAGAGGIVRRAAVAMTDMPGDSRLVRAARVQSSLSLDRWRPGEFFADGSAGWRRDVLAEMTEKRGGFSKGNRARIVVALSERAAHAV